MRRVCCCVELSSIWIRGWCQGKAMSDDGASVCALGALTLAAGRLVEPGSAGATFGECEVERDIWRRLNVTAKLLGYSGIMEMNDTRGVTKDRVIAVFEEAAGDTVEFCPAYPSEAHSLLSPEIWHHLTFWR